MNFLREPLIHFLLAGLVLFGVYASVQQNVEEEPPPPLPQIVISQGRIDTLASRFEKVWNRPPSDKELEGLIDEFIREEVYYREALEIKLEEDDVIIRRRLRQKLEFMYNDLITPTNASDQVLSEFLNKNADAYLTEPVLSFTQIYFNSDKRGDAAVADAEAALKGLSGKGLDVDLKSLGDRTLLDPVMTDVAPREVQRAFGKDFVDALLKQEVGTWSGPVQSGFGVHLVYLAKHTPSATPELSAVRDEILRDWAYDQKQQANEAVYDRLKAKYEIRVEREEK